jgi:hypothetical protein
VSGKGQGNQKEQQRTRVAAGKQFHDHQLVHAYCQDQHTPAATRAAATRVLATHVLLLATHVLLLAT